MHWVSRHWRSSPIPWCWRVLLRPKGSTPGVCAIVPRACRGRSTCAASTSPCRRVSVGRLCERGRVSADFTSRALGAADLDRAAQLHHEAFAEHGERGWTHAEIAELLASPGVTGVLLQREGNDIGFA